MTTLREGPRIQTRLSLEEHLRFQKAMVKHNLTIGQLTRDAIAFYLDKLDQGALDEKERILERRIKKMEDRLSGLVARANIDVGVILTLMYARMKRETRDEELKMARNKSAQRLNKNIELLEQEAQQRERDNRNGSGDKK